MNLVTHHHHAVEVEVVSWKNTRLYIFKTLLYTIFTSSRQLTRMEKQFTCSVAAV